MSVPKQEDLLSEIEGFDVDLSWAQRGALEITLIQPREQAVSKDLV